MRGGGVREGQWGGGVAQGHSVGLFAFGGDWVGGGGPGGAIWGGGGFGVACPRPKVITGSPHLTMLVRRNEILQISFMAAFCHVPICHVASSAFFCCVS